MAPLWPVVLAMSVSSCGTPHRASLPQVRAVLQQYQVVQGPTTLSPDNPHGKDEDPTLIRSRDGRCVVCWFSNRNGHDNLYLMSSQDGIQWSQPVQVTATTDRDFYPSLHQDARGRFHLAWFRVSKVPPFARHIWYTHSDDGLHWNPADEVQVTTGWVFDWAPSLWADATGRALIYFASKRRGDAARKLYVSQSADGGRTWSDPVKAAGVNDPSAHDDFPYLAQRQDGIFLLAWTRSTKRSPFGLFDPSMDIYAATSRDGLQWQQSVNVSGRGAPGVTDALPFLYPRQGGDWSLGWVSTRTDRRGDIVAVPLSQLEDADQHLALLVRRPDAVDYSARVVPAPTPGTYLVVWVTARGKAKMLLRQLVQG